MSWFSYVDGQKTISPPVRREIVFPNISDNLKVGDWIHINVSDYDIGRLFYYENGLIKSKADDDSYIVVFENGSTYTPTTSLIAGSNSDKAYDRNLWFKSVTDVSAGSKPAGKYYVYYHKDNVQYLQSAGPEYGSATPFYTATTPPSGFNYIATESGSSAKSINFYSHECKADQTNQRVSAVSFLGSIEVWNNQTSSQVGAKAIGTFSGPNIKIFTKKGPDFGKIKIKFIKTSAVGDGQKVVGQDQIVDLYDPFLKSDQEISIFAATSDQTLATYNEIYGDFSFEIEILAEKNNASSGNKCTIEKYSFSKNYQLQLKDEEIKPEISFKSIGGLK